MRALLDAEAERVGRVQARDQGPAQWSSASYYSGEKELTRVTAQREHSSRWFRQLSRRGGHAWTTSIQHAGGPQDHHAHHRAGGGDGVRRHRPEPAGEAVPGRLHPGYLRRMVKTVNINNKVIGDLDIISDFAYGLGDHQRLHALPARHRSSTTRSPACCCAPPSSSSPPYSTCPSYAYPRPTRADDVSVADKYSSRPHRLCAQRAGHRARLRLPAAGFAIIHTTERAAQGACPPS